MRSEWLAPVLLAMLAAASAADAQTPRLAAGATIGCDDCDGPDLFANIQAVHWLTGGDVMVLDLDAPFVRVFSMDGELRAAFGREGDGPGELRLPQTGAQVAADTLEILDLRLRRLQRYTLAGAAAGVRTFPPDAFPLVAMRDPGRRAWVLATTDFRAPTATLRRLPDDAADADALFTLDASFPRDADGAPTPYTAYAVAPDGSVYVGEGAYAYRIRAFAPEGAVRGEIERDLPLPRRSPAEMSEEHERIARSAARLRAMRAAEGGGPGRAPHVKERKNHFDVGSLAFDPQGRLWVRTNRGDGRHTVFDVFAGTRLLGEVTVDAAIDDWALGPAGLVAEVRTTDSIPRVRIWRWQ